MKGKELKERINALHLTSREVANRIGVSEQAMQSYYKTTDIRKSTLDVIDKAVYELTGQSIFPSESGTEAPQVNVLNHESLINATITAKNELISSLKEQISTSSMIHAREVTSLRDSLVVKDELIETMRSEIDAKDALITSLREQIAEYQKDCVGTIYPVGTAETITSSSPSVV